MDREEKKRKRFYSFVFKLQLEKINKNKNNKNNKGNSNKICNKLKLYKTSPQKKLNKADLNYRKLI